MEKNIGGTLWKEVRKKNNNNKELEMKKESLEVSVYTHTYLP